MTLLYIIIIIAILILWSVFTVKQQTTAMVERFGGFQSIRKPGIHLKIPLIDKIAGRVNLKVQQLEVLIETKTKDSVFVKLEVSVQYKVIDDRVYDAFYKLQSHKDQITSYVYDVVRAEVPKMTVDDVFEKKNDIADAVKIELNDAMVEYGYDIIKTLVTDIDPDSEVKIAMNRINAAQREEVAAKHEGEAVRVKIVAEAKAEAESKRLQGQGIADQRREIAQGLFDSVDILHKVGINSQEASALIVVTQHYDTLESIGGDTNSNLILLPNAPEAGSKMLNDMVAAFSASNQIGEEMKEANRKKEAESKNAKGNSPADNTQYDDYEEEE